MGTSGRFHAGRGLTEKQEQFGRLIAAGVSNAQACRTVGINRRTGTRWQRGRTIRNTAGEPVHYPPVSTPTPPAPRHPRYLSVHERTIIADLLREHATVRAIAAALGRNPSTISRELRRNRDGAGRYLPGVADRLATGRTPRPRQRRLATDQDLRRVVMELLGKRWSPEQVAHELPERFPGERARHVCTESIYQGIYDPGVDLTRPAKRRRRRRRHRVQGLERRGRLRAMTMIADRPKAVDDRVQVGHWEGDCIMGRANRSAIGTLVERHTRFLILVHVPATTSRAEAIRDGVSTAFAGLPVNLRRTLTWDQGKELALHQQITEATGTQVFFCDAHSPWQRGSNENMNGLLRDYFPKGTDLGVVTSEHLQHVAQEINDRPRKTLRWARPGNLLNSQRLQAEA